jgi:hypothetical protein
MPRTPLIRTKAAAKRNEETDIATIITYINDPVSPIGIALRQMFYDTIGKPLLEAALAVPIPPTQAQAHTPRPGSRHAHYDFVIRTTNDVWLKVEHKGSAVRAPINPAQPPWIQGVQFYNGGMEKYRFAVRYATAWYDKYVGSGLLKERYSISAPIPTLTEWLHGDAKTQGDPKTPFGRELKATFRAANGDRTSMRQERDEFVTEFFATCSADDEATLAADILPLIRQTLAEKDVWLQVAGDVATGEFDFLWRPQLVIERIESVSFVPGRADICMEVRCGGGLCLSPILRWGKGAGFSNLRLDLK